MTDDKKTGGAPKDVMGFLDYYLVKKAPFQIPSKAKDWIVKFGPWIDLVLLILFLPAILFALGVSAYVMPFAGAYAPGLGLAVVILIVQLGMMGVAIPYLLKRKLMGWNLLLYSTVLNLVYGVMTGNFFGSIIGALISLYVLFQIREYYTK